MHTRLFAAIPQCGACTAAHHSARALPKTSQNRRRSIAAVQRRFMHVRVAPQTHDETCVSHVCKCFTCILIYLPRYNCMEHARASTVTVTSITMAAGVFDLVVLRRQQQAVVCMHVTLFDGCVFLVCECSTCILVYLRQYHSVEHARLPIIAHVPCQKRRRTADVQ
jgi:hypothetical protein